MSNDNYDDKNNYYDYGSDYSHEEDCCNHHCGCPEPPKKTDRLYNTSNFSEQTNHILEMYYLFNQRFPNLFDTNHANESYFDDFKEGKDHDVRYDLNFLSYECSDYEQEELFQKHGYILMNHYSPRVHQKLVIGCGHGPLENDMDTQFWKRYSQNHEHRGCYTIDPDLCKNADTIGVYGEQVFRHLPNEAFTEIQAEGVRIQPTPIFISETTRLLKEGGVLYSMGVPYCAKIGGRLAPNPMFKYCGKGTYLGISDIFEWNNVRYNSGPLNTKTNKCSYIKGLPQCHHLKYEPSRPKLETGYDEDELSTLFMKINIGEKNVVFKDVRSHDHLVGRTKYHFSIKREGKEDLKFQYSPQSDDFTKSKELMMCGHQVPIEHQIMEICGIQMVFTAEYGRMVYLSFQDPCLCGYDG